jgi:putative Mn2+ efflux pump MntP
LEVNVGFWSLLALSFGLAMDATAVAAARGSATPRVLGRHVLCVALYFGGFQALMPALGWLLGESIGSFVSAGSPWIAFFLLGGVGAKMLWEARLEHHEKAAAGTDPFGARVMLLLALATSLDAFAVGVSLPLLRAPFTLALATIGITTALLSTAGLFCGRHFGGVLGRRAELAGGLILIGLGSMILIQHLRTA